MVLESFYRTTDKEGLDYLSEDENTMMKKAIETKEFKKRSVGFETVEQQYMLWRKVTSKSFLPLLPCRQIIPILCSYWN